MSRAPRLATVVLDGPDVGRLSSFWAQLLGGRVEVVDETWHTIRAPGMPSLAAQLSPGHQPPRWPDGPPQQVHLDFDVEDIAEAHARALAAGPAVLLPQDGPDATQAHGYQVYADPAGHPFCLCWGQ